MLDLKNTFEDILNNIKLKITYLFNDPNKYGTFQLNICVICPEMRAKCRKHPGKMSGRVSRYCIHYAFSLHYLCVFVRDCLRSRLCAFVCVN